MGATRRKFTLEFRIDAGRSVHEVASELSVLENSLSKWVRDERRRLETIAGTTDEPLSPAERAELLRLRRTVEEQEKLCVHFSQQRGARPRRSSKPCSRTPRRGRCARAVRT